MSFPTNNVEVYMLSTHNIISKTLASKKSSIIEPQSISDILKVCSFDSCVVFDFDNTLGEPVNPFASDEMFDVLLAYAYKEMQREEARDIVLTICHAMQFCTSMRPVEENKTVRVVEILNDIHIPTLLVTARGPELIERTTQQLKEMNICFSSAWPQTTFELNVGNPLNPPVYSNGKIFCNGNDKDICMRAFFDYIGYQPPHLVMADDKLHHLIKTKKMMEENNGRFDGLHYRYLDSKVEKFKQEFDLQLSIPLLLNDLLEISSVQKKNEALQAINKYSITVLKSQSIFAVTNIATNQAEKQYTNTNSGGGQFGFI